MKKVIMQSSYNQLTASGISEFGTVRFEHESILEDGSTWNIGRVTLNREQVQAMLAYFDELDK